MILSTKLLRPVMRGDLKHCCKCGKPASYYDAALPAQAPQFYCSDDALLEDMDHKEYANQRLLVGAPVSRLAAFPECMDIGELFTKADVVPPGQQRKGSQMWCNVLKNARPFVKLDLVPQSELLEWIKQHSIYGHEQPLDRSHYVTIHLREHDRVAVIFLKFQQIIGSHLIAMVPWETVEKFFGATSQ